MNQTVARTTYVLTCLSTSCAYSAGRKKSEKLAILFEEWNKCCEDWTSSSFVVRMRERTTEKQKGGRRWMTEGDIVDKYSKGRTQEEAKQIARDIVLGKEACKHMKATHIRPHPDAPLRADMRLFLIWDEEYESSETDSIVESLFESKDSDEGKKKKRKQKSSASSAQSDQSSDSESKSSSSSDRRKKKSKKAMKSKHKKEKRGGKKTKKAKKDKKDVKVKSESDSDSSQSDDDSEARAVAAAKAEKQAEKDREKEKKEAAKNEAKEKKRLENEQKKEATKAVNKKKSAVKKARFFLSIETLHCRNGKWQWSKQ